MIASHGGMILDKSGGRLIPGSGGLVGGLSLPGRNTAWIGGAGKSYETFTPVINESIPGDYPNVPRDPDYPQWPTEPGEIPGPGPQIPAPSPGPNTPTTPTTPTTPGPTQNTPPIIDPGGIRTIIDRVLDSLGSKTQVKTEGPLYLFTPGQPAQPVQSGVNMNQIIILGAVAAVAWFAYKRFKS